MQSDFEVGKNRASLKSGSIPQLKLCERNKTEQGEWIRCGFEIIGSLFVFQTFNQDSWQNPVASRLINIVHFPYPALVFVDVLRWFFAPISVNGL